MLEGKKEDETQSKIHIEDVEAESQDLKSSVMQRYQNNVNSDAISMSEIMAS